jgi:hypothetical protein
MNETITSAIRAALDAANGRRRTRLADLDDVLHLVDQARSFEDRTGVRVTFGVVPNSYGYAASATVVTVARVDGVVRLTIKEGRAATKAYGGPGYMESTQNRDVHALVESPPAHIAIPLCAHDDCAASPEMAKACASSRI